MSSAPASTMPWMELAADISGVCRVAGTLPMTSMPTSSASTKMVRSVTSAVDIGPSLARGLQQGRGGLLDDLAAVGDDHARLDLVVEVNRERAVPDHVQQHGGHVAGVGVGGGGGHTGGQVARADDRDPIVGDDGLARLGPGHVAAQRAGSH